MPRRCSGTAGGNRRRSSGNKLNLPHGQFLATAAMSGAGHVHSFGAGQMTAHAALSSSGGMLGLLGTGATAASAALTGTGSVVAAGNSFFQPGTSGPSSGTSFSSDLIVGLQFGVTASGHHLTGYYIWVQLGTNPNPTIPQKCALYLYAAGVWTVQSAATATSGTLVAGWNLVSLGTPYLLVTSTPYCFATGVNGNFNITDNSFGSGDPYAAGITSGPAICYSDVSGSAPSPSTYAQGLYSTAGSDPTTTFPNDGVSSYNPWLDVVIT